MQSLSICSEGISISLDNKSKWPERLSLPMPDAWRGKLEYSSENQSRFFQLIPPLDKDNKLSISSK